MPATNHVVLAGAALDSGNRGVEALGHAVIHGLQRYLPRSVVSVLDNGWGVRPGAVGGVESVNVQHVGVRVSRRVHRPESWTRVNASLALGGRRNEVARRLATATAVWDISGGDSFTDLYGGLRLRQICAPKRAALRSATPLVLLPQTYGPFRDPRNRELASRLVRGAHRAWARDRQSFELLQELAGEDHLDNCRDGVDVAFALPTHDPGQAISEELRAQLAVPGSCVGVNVSGLLWFAPPSAAYATAVDYRSLVAAVVQGLVDTGRVVILVPHVTGGAESDDAAIEELMRGLPKRTTASIQRAPAELRAAELKWVISRCDWFWGARMHATIAALSSHVPVAALGYSDKTRGVFSTLGLGDRVLDARASSSARTVADQLLAEFANRSECRDQLSASLPAVLERAQAQMEELVTLLSPATLDETVAP